MDVTNLPSPTAFAPYRKRTSHVLAVVREAGLLAVAEVEGPRRGPYLDHGGH